MKYLVQPLVPDAANAPQHGGDRVYTLTSSASGKVMAAYNGKIVQHIWKEQSYQQWKLKQLANGNYKVVNLYSGNVLTVANASTSSGTPLVAKPWGQHLHQQWKLVEQDGHYRLKAAHSNMSLAVPGGNPEPGTQLEQRNTGDYPAQKWLLGEVRNISEMFDARVTLYTEPELGGDSRELGPGAYRMEDIGLPGNCIRSLDVPLGLRITLYADANFRGARKSFSYDASVDGDLVTGTSAILVEKVVTIYRDDNYHGQSQSLGVGRYRIKDLEIPDNNVTSLLVPQGLMAILYEHDDFSGRRRVFFEDADLYQTDSEFQDITSSIIVKATGVFIPRQALQFGGKLALESVAHGKHARVTDTLDARADVDSVGGWTKLTLVRAGHTKHNNLLSYGDVVALEHVHGGKYLRLMADGSVDGQGGEGGGWTLFQIERAGQSHHNSFVAKGDVVALRSVEFGRYLQATADGDMRGNSDSVGAAQKWKIDWMQPPEPSTVGAGVGALSTSVCGAAVAGWSEGVVGACGAAACGADICGAAACGAAANLVAACGAAASIVAVCAAAVGVASVCGAAAYGAVAVGLAACGADACVTAACGAAACAAAACGAAACGADACGAAAAGAGANLTGACGAETGGVDACLADACAANACGLNLCPADACAADACAIDLIPIIPFI